MVSQNSGHASLIGSGFGGYEVQALIGRGAMGTVYLARDVALGRPVALKVLLGSLARNPAMVRGFYREAQAAAPLRHPNIVRVYTAGIESGTPYIAMEYVPGESIVELKSLKLYLWSFRDEGHFHEDVTNRILDDLVALLAPRRMTVRTEWNIRGGIETVVTASHPSPGS